MILVIDTETTGFDAQRDAVVEVAAVPVKLTHEAGGWEVQPGVSSLVAPGRRIPPGAQSVHHISNEEVRDAPKLRGALQRILYHDLRVDLRSLDCVAAHNAEFDRGFIGHFFPRSVPWLCTWRAAKHVWPDASIYSNQGLRYEVPGLNERLKPHLSGDTAHRALYDATTTAFLLQAMLAKEPLARLLELQDQPALQKTCNFGAHRGRLWADVPQDYMRWILRSNRDKPFDRDIIYTVKHHLGIAA